MKLAIVGVTGLVGRTMLKVLEERNFQISELIPVATEKSIGKTVFFNDFPYKVLSVDEALRMNPDIALFSAGGEASLLLAPKFAETGCFVVDNSSAWRMNKDKKLIVPEINAGELTLNDRIIANPNCSTIQLVMAVASLHKKYSAKRIIVSTYQSVTGTGKAAVSQMYNERKDIQSEMVYPHKIDKNCIPHCDIFLENDYTKEEMKLVHETNKILNSQINISATAVRVPVEGGHSESVNIEFEKDFDINDVRNLLTNFPGVILYDNVSENIYPMPIVSQGKDEVFVGRVRRDFSNPKTLNMWIVADNLRKGAATNAVQIAEYIKKNIFKK